MAELRYIHNLENRKTGYLNVGYWVINEIQRAKALNLDWKKDYDKLRYSSDLYTIATMFEMYDEVIVQESRNGYLFTKKQVEEGYLYLNYHFDDGGDIPEPEPDPDPIETNIHINPLSLVVM